MIKSSLPVSIQTLLKYKENAILRNDLSFQPKSGLWSNITKSLFIHSLLSSSYIPSLLFWKYSEEDDSGKPQNMFSILDGAQRMSAIMDFIGEEGYRLNSSVPLCDVDGDEYEIAGLTYEELPQELKNSLMGIKLPITCLEDMTEEQSELIFASVNSGLPLSVVQRAKPEMGSELCDYFAEITSNEFFTQGCAFTSAMAIREDDLLCALQGFMLSSSDYDSWKSISTKECLEFCKYLRGNWNEDDARRFKVAVEDLNVYQKKCKYLKKNNIPIILAVSVWLSTEGVEGKEMKAFFDDFYSSENPEYYQYSGSGNVKRSNSLGRLRVLRSAASEYFDIEVPEEYSEVNANEESSDESE